MAQHSPGTAPRRPIPPLYSPPLLEFLAPETGVKLGNLSIVECSSLSHGAMGTVGVKLTACRVFWSDESAEPPPPPREIIDPRMSLLVWAPRVVAGRTVLPVVSSKCLPLLCLVSQTGDYPGGRSRFANVGYVLICRSSPLVLLKVQL